MIANGDDEGLGNNNNNNDCDNRDGDSMTIELDHHLVGINDQPLQLFFFTTIAFFLGLVSSHHTALHYNHILMMTMTPFPFQIPSYVSPPLNLSLYLSLYPFLIIIEWYWILKAIYSYIYVVGIGIGLDGTEICQGPFEEHLMVLITFFRQVTCAIEESRWRPQNKFVSSLEAPRQQAMGEVH